MPDSRASVLVVDDDLAMCDLLVEQFNEHGLQACARATATEGLVALERGSFDVVVTDLNMRGINGIEFCHRITQAHPGLPVIVITAFGSLKTATAALRVGAHDFISKPFELEALMHAVRRAHEHRALRREVQRLRTRVDDDTVRGLIGESAPMRTLQRRVRQAADVRASVLIRGESGTGKELVARAIHGYSARAAGPFVAVSLAAMSAATLAGELFGRLGHTGHVRPGFTGDEARRDGLLAAADAGTLYLDEIGELPLELQPKLLRVLEDGVVRPGGGQREREFNVRVIAATNRDLETAVDEGRFRRDLFYRLNVLELETPPLRSRGRDILLLAQRFLEQHADASQKPVRSISTEAASLLLAYPWPGNVRELKNCVEHAVALSEYPQLMPANLPTRVQHYRHEHFLVFSENPDELAPLETVERRYILRVLDAVGGNKSKAAQILGVGRRTLYRKLERYGYKDADEGDGALAQG